MSLAHLPNFHLIPDLAMSEKTNNFKLFYEELRSTFHLNIDYAKLTLAEKLVVLFTAVSLVALIFVLASLFMFFISLGLVRLLATGMDIYWAYFIMGGFYLILLVLMLIFRQKLIVNPISRFVSKLIFKP